MNRIAMQQKLTQIFLSQEAGAPGNNIEKELQKQCPRLKYLQKIFALTAVQCKW